MTSFALVIEKLRTSGNNIKPFVPHTITNQRHIATGSRTCTDSSSINSEIPLKLALAFVKGASSFDSWTSSSYKFKMFGLSSLVCKVNGVPLYNVFFNKFL